MLKYSKRFTKEEKIRILSESSEGGLTLSELARKYQISPHTLYNWRNTMKRQMEDPLNPAELLYEIRSLKIENSRLKQTVADQALDITTLKQWNDFVKKKLREEKLNFQRNSLAQKKSKSPKKDSVS